MRSTRAWFAGLLIVGAACASSPGSNSSPVSTCAPDPATGDLPCDVAAVLKAKCEPCHQTPRQFNAPFALTTYEDTQQPFGLAPSDGGPPKRRWQRMAEVIAPGGLPRMPKPGVEACDGQACSLTDAERKTLEDWFTACAPPRPEGTGCDVGE